MRKNTFRNSCHTKLFNPAIERLTVTHTEYHIYSVLALQILLQSIIPWWALSQKTSNTWKKLLSGFHKSCVHWIISWILIILVPAQINCHSMKPLHKQEHNNDYNTVWLTVNLKKATNSRANEWENIIKVHKLLPLLQLQPSHMTR